MRHSTAACASLCRAPRRARSLYSGCRRALFLSCLGLLTPPSPARKQGQGQEGQQEGNSRRRERAGARSWKEASLAAAVYPPGRPAHASPARLPLQDEEAAPARPDAGSDDEKADSGKPKAVKPSKAAAKKKGKAGKHDDWSDDEKKPAAAAAAEEDEEAPPLHSNPAPAPHAPHRRTRPRPPRPARRRAARAAASQPSPR